MNPVRRFFILVCVLAVGCGTPPTATHVASLTDSANTDYANSGDALAGDAVAARAAPKESAPVQADRVAAAVNESTPEATPQNETVTTAGPQGAASLQSNAPQEGNPVAYTVRKAVPPPPPAIPRVLLSASHQKLCKINVGDSVPALSLPRLGGQTTTLSSLRGKQATVVLFWHPDRWMARTALIDMQRDIANKFAREDVAVVGVAVRQAAGAVQPALNVSQATFAQLLDTDGKAFAAVGSLALPRIYVLDPTGKVVWFDIEYSEGTRRELGQTLDVLAKQ